MKSMKFITSFALCVAISNLATSCSTTKKVSTELKAKPVALSAFIQHRSEMRPQRERAPFALAWVNPALPERRAGYSSIYIAPVKTSYLRPAKKTMTENVAGASDKPRPVSEISMLLRNSFVEAFEKSPDARVSLSSSPKAGGVTLTLALIELNPTDAAGNLVKSAIPYGGVLSSFTRGNIAIEGSVRDNVTGELLFEFADNERDKMSLGSIRDFAALEHAKVAIKEWAQQFEELTRTPRTHTVEDSLSFTLNPL
jgi:hypothetical protein